jgi:DNA-binding NtrC family response regulator
MLDGVRVLVVDDEADIARGIARLLERAGAVVRTAASGEEAVPHIAAGWAQMVVSDMRLGGMSGTDLLEETLRLRPGTPFILITGFGSIELAVEALQRGAAHFVTKPFDTDEFTATVARFARSVRARAAAGGGGLIAVDARMRQVIDLVDHVAATSVPVLITGESGTGKEVTARAVHARSRVAARPFLAVNCAALPDALLESELFGYKRGAFTGAVRDHDGMFAQADGGSVFLDELPSMSLAFQGKLLRVLQEKTVRPLGASHDEAVHFRLIAASNRDLRALVDAGAFREDLFYRLSVFAIELPPLRARGDDIAPLALHFLAEAARMLLGDDASAPDITPAALDLLQAHPWPGNVRELENVMQRALIMSRGARIQPAHLLLGARTHESATDDASYEDAKQQAIASFQRAYLRRALARSHGNVTQAAERCGMTRVALQKLMRRLDLDREDFTS